MNELLEMKMVSVNSLMIEPAIRDALRGLSETEWNGLLEDIKKEGKILNPLLTSAGVVIDGHHRLKIAVHLGWEEVPVISIPFPGKEAMVKMCINGQRHRRNMSKEDWKTVIFETAEKVKTEIGERRGKPKLAPSGANYTDPVNTDGTEVSTLIKFNTEIGKKTSEIVAEIVEEETGIQTSPRTVERVTTKQKPKRVFKKKETVTGVVIFRKIEEHKWMAHHDIYTSKKEAKEAVDLSIEQKEGYFLMELGYAYVDIDFFNEQEQKHFLKVDDGEE